MGFLLNLLGGLQAKLVIVGLVVTATVLVLFGAFRAGGRAADAASTRRTLEKAVKHRKLREKINEEIREDGDNPYRVLAADRLHGEWSRDGLGGRGV